MLSQSQRTTILELHAQGISKREIARVLNVSRLSVRKVLRSRSSALPVLVRPEKAETYRVQILELLASHKGNLVRVHEELVSRGAEVSYPALTAFCRRHGIGQQPKVAAGVTITSSPVRSSSTSADSRSGSGISGPAVRAHSARTGASGPPRISSAVRSSGSGTGTEVAGRPAQDVRRAAAPEAQQDVLRPAGQLGRVLDLAGGQPLLVHPAAERGQVDEAVER